MLELWGYNFFFLEKSFNLFNFSFAEEVEDVGTCSKFTCSHRLCKLVKFIDLTSFRI